uniref:Uncharacterized protein n=1 Tax=Candidatus Kentrum sp. DK TaxID=2126562 RepID=A0A450S0C1_9GAMM|nr:MAG: hypothetical protein BECKDK2373C_GA0170839_100942 [Candidatus Kentron sp. DK]VFJ44926.1 MAG: hypothetical protein BECKDK2373B_GA0170837_100852 [Candidatus Kentron sp. DK]
MFVFQKPKNILLYRAELSFRSGTNYVIPPQQLTRKRECLDLPEKTGSSLICHILADTIAVFAPKGLRNLAQGCRVAATLGGGNERETTPTGLRNKASWKR